MIGGFFFFLEDSPKPVITVQPSDTMGLRGGNATLECLAKASDEAQITVQWKRDNEVWRIYRRFVPDSPPPRLRRLLFGFFPEFRAQGVIFVA